MSGVGHLQTCPAHDGSSASPPESGHCNHDTECRLRAKIRHWLFWPLSAYAARGTVAANWPLTADADLIIVWVGHGSVGKSATLGSLRPEDR